MKKILIVTSTYYFIRAFLIPHIRHLTQSGYIVHVASAPDNSIIPYVRKQIDIPVERTPFSHNNLKAIKILSDQILLEKYDLLHCHTPMGAYVARMAVKKNKGHLDTKIIYTAHGFHFFKGAPLGNWALYYTAEKYLSRYTDAIITINQEDKEAARTCFPRIPYQYNLPGIGYDKEHIGDIRSLDKAAVRRQLKLGKGDFVLLYIAGFYKGKNHDFLLSLLPAILRQIPDCKMLFLGNGPLLEHARRSVHRMKIEQSVIFAGYQSQIGPYLKAADVGVSSSLREGLPLNIIEEMYAALPIVATRIRGHIDLVEHGSNGYLYDVNDKSAFLNCITHLYRDPHTRSVMGEKAYSGIEKYDISNILPRISEIYDNILRMK